MKRNYTYSLVALIGSISVLTLAGCDGGSEATNDSENHIHESESNHDTAMPDHHETSGASHAEHSH